MTRQLLRRWAEGEDVGDLLDAITEDPDASETSGEWCGLDTAEYAAVLSYTDGLRKHAQKREERQDGNG